MVSLGHNELSSIKKYALHDPKEMNWFKINQFWTMNYDFWLKPELIILLINKSIVYCYQVQYMISITVSIV